jgi:hypothetical protein
MTLINLTRWAASTIPSYDRDARDVLVVVVAATFDIPEQPDAIPQPSAEQPSVPLVDEFAGETGTSGPTRAAQAVYVRPGADVYVRGHVHADEPTTAREVSVAVEQLERRAWVIGDRRWTRALTGWQATPPEPFETMPIVWERCHGHPSDARNPVGCQPPATAIEGAPLPNFEHPNQLVSAPEQRVEPVGFGPIAPHWQPRRGYGGSYDETWQRERAPYWPEDLDLRFFQAAAPGLRLDHVFNGGEQVRLLGFLPGPMRRFALPRLRLLSKSHHRDTDDRELLRVDALEIDLDQRRFTLYARAQVVLDGGYGALREVVLRELRDWEPNP